MQSDYSFRIILSSSTPASDRAPGSISRFGGRCWPDVHTPQVASAAAPSHYAMENERSVRLPGAEPRVDLD